MNMNINIPTCWEQCSEYQLCELSDFFMNDKPIKNPVTHLLKVIFVQEKQWWKRFKYAYLTSRVPPSALLQYLNFLKEEPDLYHFPQIKGLKKPTDRLGNLTIKQFSVCDTLFYKFLKEKNTLYLRQLVASLYLIDEFDENRLIEVAEITDKIPLKKARRIAFAYMCCRNYIAGSFPKIFPKEKKHSYDEIKPVFNNTRTQEYRPFNEVIVAMVFDEAQPLGNYQQAKKVKLYEFLSLFTYCLIRNEKLQSVYKNAKA